MKIQPFCIFAPENNTKQGDFNAVRKVREGATIIVLWKAWPKKGSAYLERDSDTDRLQTSVYIHTFVFTCTHTGPFCHNPVEYRPITLDSSSIPLDSTRQNGCIPAGICEASKSTQSPAKLGRISAKVEDNVQNSSFRYMSCDLIWPYQNLCRWLNSKIGLNQVNGDLFTRTT